MIELDIVKNTNGTITTNIKLIKISPKGLKIVAFSLKIRPTMVPKIIPPIRIIVLL